MLNIDPDRARFRDIIKGRVRKDLRKYMSSREMIGRKGKNTVSIPLPQIGLPRFRYGENKGGVGQGEGDEGDGAGQGQKAGDKPGEHVLEVELTIEELAELLGEEPETIDVESVGPRLTFLLGSKVVEIDGREIAFDPAADIVFKRDERHPGHANAIRCFACAGDATLGRSINGTDLDLTGGPGATSFNYEEITWTVFSFPTPEFIAFGAETSL